MDIWSVGGECWVSLICVYHILIVCTSCVHHMTLLQSTGFIGKMQNSDFYIQKIQYTLSDQLCILTTVM